MILPIAESLHDEAEKRPGRPFAKLPRRLVVGRSGQGAEWAKLSSAAQTVLPIISVLSNGLLSGASLPTLAHYAQCSETTVTVGIRGLESMGFIERHRRWSHDGSPISSQTTLNSSLMAGRREFFGRFSRELITGGAWAELSPAARSLMVVLLVGVQHEQLMTWQETNPPRIKAGNYWQSVVRSLLNDRSFRSRQLDAIPKASWTRGDYGLIGIGHLCKLTGRSVPAIRDSITQLEKLELAVCFRPNETGWESHAFFVPPNHNYQKDEHFARPPRHYRLPHPPPSQRSSSSRGNASSGKVPTEPSGDTPF